MIGKTISHYRILEKLGEGGMGVVYKAEDTKLKRTVALKFLTPQALGGEEEKTRFLREAQAASALNHPNIMTIYEIDDVEDKAFIAMEYVEGETLKDKLEKGPLKTKELLNITISVADGLNAAHEQEIIHRDIKSENIMISKTGLVKIMDFGLAKRKGMSRITRTGSTLGTLAYMSPEQAEGLEVDRRSDLFSFGVVLYEIATGQLPFKGEHDAAILYSIVNEAPLPITTLNPNIPPELGRIIHKALEKEPEDRYQHADDLAADLRKLKKDLESGKSKVELTKTKVIVKKQVYLYGGVMGIVVLTFFAAYFLLLSKPGSGDMKSIAVLPFKSLSEVKQDEYFTDGITEDIIMQLSKIGNLKVISRTSAMQYKNTNKSLRDIGKELDVATILEGSVRRVGNEVRIVAQLIDARKDEHLWAETYDKDMSDIFAIQSDVAEQIANALRVELSPAEKTLLERKPTANLTAYEDYLNARFYWNKRTREDTRKAVEFFEAAIAKDSNYALAYSGLADCYVVNAGRLLGIPVDEAMSKARNYALKALELDSNLVEPRTVLAQIRWLNDWDLWGADEEFKQALQLNPNYVTSLRRYAYALVAMGRGDEAIQRIEQAYRLDPLSFVTNIDMSQLLRLARRYDEAIVQSNKTLRMDPNHSFARLVLAASYRQKGMMKEAAEEFEKAGDIFNMQLSLGKKDDARRVLEEGISREEPSRFELVLIAGQYAALGETEKAFKWLEKSYVRRSPWLIYLKVFPEFDKLRNDPRFGALAKKLGLEK